MTKFYLKFDIYYESSLQLVQCKCTIEQSSLVECGKNAVDLKDNEMQASIINQSVSQSPNIPKVSVVFSFLLLKLSFFRVLP